MLLRHAADRDGQAGKYIKHQFASSLVPNDHGLDPVRLDPPCDEVAEIAQSEDAARQNSLGTAHRHAAFLSSGIDGQHRHRNVTITGPMV